MLTFFHTTQNALHTTSGAYCAEHAQEHILPLSQNQVLRPAQDRLYSPFLKKRNDKMFYKIKFNLEINLSTLNFNKRFNNMTHIFLFFNTLSEEYSPKI